MAHDTLELAYLLGRYLREQRLGEVIISPADVMFGPRTYGGAGPLRDTARTWTVTARLGGCGPSPAHGRSALAQALAWQPDRFIEPLVIDLPKYFGRVLGESR